MAIDMSQFYQVFFEEAAEHLANMESLLLGLDVEAPDTEQLNAVFRAAHSIKGSAGTFGFTDMAEVTHVLENLLDRIRKGEMALRNDMIDAFLDAGDVLKSLLAAHRGEDSADPESVGTICERLSALTTGAEQQAAPVSVVVETTVETTTAPSTAQGFQLRFILEATADGGAETADNLLTTLAGLGTVTVVHRPGADEPSGVWQLTLEGEVDEADVRDILEFVARSDSLRIDALGAEADHDDGAYGFFDDDGATEAVTANALDDVDDAFGFFTDPVQIEGAASDGVTASSDDPDGAFGFFTDPVSAGSVAGDGSTVAGNDDPDGAFGFFLPVLPVDADAPVADVITQDDPSGAFGFFAPVVAAKQVTTPVVEVKATPATPAAATERKPAAASKPSVPAAAAEATIRVGVEKVDQLINLIGELVITQAMLAQSASALDPVEFERLHNGLAQLERNTRDMQESVMSIRMMPISVVFSRFPRVVRDLSQKLGKRVELKMIGESTELDRSLIERITDPLTHLVRNSLDHGVEMPEDRAAKGKQPMGTITLKAYHQSGNIVIEVSDDGAGLNRQKILSKAKERGLANTHDGMTDSEVWQLIFEPGFSTADQITEVSGRGVGMDVVKKNITAMGGRVEIESMTGIGTRMTVRLPLTLAILDGMSVAVGKETYIIPLGYVVESLQASRNMIKSVSGVERLIQVRDEYLPVVALFEVFSVGSARTRLDEGIMVILEADGIKAALFVDALVGQHQVVIKSLEANYRKVPGVSGATIMGDGHVALILDIAALVAMARSSLPAAA
jgi:two-component system chemotaxis sensor kinase CheA